MGNTVRRCAKAVWRGAKSVARSVWKTTKYVAKGIYRTGKVIYKASKCVIRKTYNGMKWLYKKSEKWIKSGKQWLWSRAKRCGSWIRRKLQKTWIGRGIVKAWDYGRRCTQWIKDKYDTAKSWVRDKIPLVGPVLARGMDWVKDSALSYVTGGLSKFVSFGSKLNTLSTVYDKIKDTKVMRWIDRADQWCKDKLDKFENYCTPKLNAIRRHIEPYVDTVNYYCEAGNWWLDKAYQGVDKYLDNKYVELCRSIHTPQVNAVRDVYQQTLFENQAAIPNFGGALVLAVKNFKNNANSKLAPPGDLGFDILQRGHGNYEGSLVQLVRDAAVTIRSCKAKRMNSTLLEVENNLQQRLHFSIPAGSVVAEQDEFRTVQNLCSQRAYDVCLEAKQRKTLDIATFCMDLDFAVPSGESANFTPLVYHNMPSNLDQSEFWTWSSPLSKHRFD